MLRSPAERMVMPPFNSVPLGQIEERNYELTLTAIHNAVFRIVLADKYDKRGKIIVCKGDTLNALTIMKEYCSTLDKCSLQDLLDFDRELTGEINHSIPMEAGYSVMVRTDKDSYVAEKYVHFNIAEIDNILDLLVTGEYIPLKSVTTFAAFPIVDILGTCFCSKAIADGLAIDFALTHHQ
jgi:hypothetical protein